MTGILSDIAVQYLCGFQGTSASMAMWIATLLYVREVSLPNLGPKTGYPDWGFDGLPQPPDGTQDGIYRRRQLFFSNSYFTNNSTTRRYMVWAADSVVKINRINTRSIWFAIYEYLPIRGSVYDILNFYEKFRLTHVQLNHTVNVIVRVLE
jgi:hypothetical protein